MGRFRKEYRVGFWVGEGVAGPSPALGLSFLLCAMGEARSIEGKWGKAHGEHYEQKINVQIKSEKLWCMPVCWGGGWLSSGAVVETSCLSKDARKLC